MDMQQCYMVHHLLIHTVPQKHVYTCRRVEKMHALCFCRLSTLVKSKSFNRKKQDIANKNFKTFPFDKTCNARLVAMMRYISKEHLFRLCCSNLRSKSTQI